MKVTSKAAAWAEVNKIFPADYEKDEAASRRAGYDIYRHATLHPNEWICDLGCRLEVITGEYGETVTNIWIVEPETIAAQVAAKAQPIIMDTVQKMTFAVSGYEWEAGPEKLLYALLGGEDGPAVALEYVHQWCCGNGGWGEKWGAARVLSLDHYGKPGDGHYCIEALIYPTTTEEE